MQTTHIQWATACVLALCAGATSAASILLEGGTLYPVSSAPVENGALLITDGKIAAIGTSGSFDVPADAARVPVAGKRVYPGFIAANSVLGLTEIEAVRASNDYAEVGPFNPNVRAEVALNPDSEAIPVTRAAGIVAVNVAPQSTQGGLFTGTAAVIKLQGWTWEEMTLKADAGVHLVWPSKRAPDFLPAPVIAELRKAADANLALIDEVSANARRYAEAAAAGAISGSADLRYAALAPVFARRQKLFVHAEDYAAVRGAIAFCSGEKLDCVLVGAQDGWRLAAELKQYDIPVILGSPFALPLRRHEGYDTVYRNAARLHAAGVRFAIAGDGSGFAAPLEKNLPHLAAQAVAFGLPAEQALAAITLSPARILGVGARLGSLEVGKDASLLVSDGDPLDFDSRIVAVYIDGQAVDLDTRHTRLYERYRRREPGAAGSAR